jgi:hypothetical protein
MKGGEKFDHAITLPLQASREIFLGRSCSNDFFMSRTLVAKAKDAE